MENFEGFIDIHYNWIWTQITIRQKVESKDRLATNFRCMYKKVDLCGPNLPEVIVEYNCCHRNHISRYCRARTMRLPIELSKSFIETYVVDVRRCQITVPQFNLRYIHIRYKHTLTKQSSVSRSFSSFNFFVKSALTVCGFIYASMQWPMLPQDNHLI